MPSTSHSIAAGAVPADYVRLLFQYLGSRGIDAPALLGEAAPDMSALPVGVAHWRRLLETAARHLGDPALGLRVGATITPADLGPLGYVLLSSATAAGALERYVRYQRLVHDVSPVRHYFGDHAQGQVLVLEWSEQSRTVGLLVNQCGMAALAAFARHCTGATGADAAAPLAVHFVEAAPDDTAPYAQTLGCPVLFGQSATRMLFPAAMLALPMRRADAALAAMLERQVDALLAALPAAPGTAVETALEQQVRRLLPQHLLHGEAVLGAVAAALNLSARTLRRRLQQQGPGFRALLEQTRRQLAQGYLADRRLALAEVALLLGYSEQSAFNRATMRWTGMTPRAWRTQLLTPHGFEPAGQADCR